MGKATAGTGSTDEKKPEKHAGAVRSRTWSCSALGEGNEKLLESKREVDEEAEEKIKDPRLRVPCNPSGHGSTAGSLKANGGWCGGRLSSKMLAFV